MDEFASQTVTLTAPAVGGVQIIPDDNNDLSHVTRALYVGGGGSVAVVMASGETVFFADMQAGAVYPIRAIRILTTGTTATSLVGLR